jgi:hypothetical protein
MISVLAFFTYIGVTAELGIGISPLENAFTNTIQRGDVFVVRRREPHG